MVVGGHLLSCPRKLSCCARTTSGDRRLKTLLPETTKPWVNPPPSRKYRNGVLCCGHIKALQTPYLGLGFRVGAITVGQTDSVG